VVRHVDHSPAFIDDIHEYPPPFQASGLALGVLTELGCVFLVSSGRLVSVVKGLGCQVSHHDLGQFGPHNMAGPA